MPLVAIVMGSDSDLPVMIEAHKILHKEFQIETHVDIVSAHRTPDKLYDFARDAHRCGFKVIIAGAGGAAHLPGMIAAISPLPVIGVPVLSKKLSGWDSLLSIAQMPPGVPVATMAIDGAANAGIKAAEIIGLLDRNVQERVVAFKTDLAKGVQRKSEQMLQMGPEAYLAYMNAKK